MKELSMSFRHQFLILIILGCVSNQVNAMWHLPDWDDVVETFAGAAERMLPSWKNDPYVRAELVKSLKNQNFKKLFEDADSMGINPNELTTPTKEFTGGHLRFVAKSKDLTAIMIACFADPTGAVVKRLLAYGGFFDMSTKIKDVWEPLWLAIKFNNWRSVDAFLACADLALTETDFAYVWSKYTEVEILRIAKSVYTARAENLMEEHNNKNH